ncbi:serine/threonine-protein kinase M1, partial [Bonamia ostreae]
NGMVEEEGLSWLKVAKEARKSNVLTVADSALMSAKLMGVPENLMFLEKAKLMKAKKRKFEAIQILQNFVEKETEKVESKNLEALKGTEVCLSKARMLLAEWSIAFKAKKSNEILSLLHISEKEPGDTKLLDKTRYLLGNYYNYLLELKIRDSSERSLVRELMYQSILFLMLSLRNGNKYLFNALPKILFMYFQYCVDGAIELNAKTENLLNKLCQEISEFQWFSVMPQIVSRLATENRSSEQFIRKIALRVFMEYPHQMCWIFLVNTEFSVFNKRHNAKKIVLEVKDIFKEHKQKYLRL